MNRIASHKRRWFYNISLYKISMFSIFSVSARSQFLGETSQKPNMPAYLKIYTHAHTYIVTDDHKLSLPIICDPRPIEGIH